MEKDTAISQREELRDENSEGCQPREGIHVREKMRQREIARETNL
jgi:hypothetical protein